MTLKDEVKKYTFEQGRNKKKQWYMKKWPDSFSVFNLLQPTLKKGINTAKMARTEAAVVIVIGVMLDGRELFYVNFSGDDWLLGR